MSGELDLALCVAGFEGEATVHDDHASTFGIPYDKSQYILGIARANIGPACMHQVNNDCEAASSLVGASGRAGSSIASRFRAQSRLPE